MDEVVNVCKRRGFIFQSSEASSSRHVAPARLPAARHLRPRATEMRPRDGTHAADQEASWRS